MELGQIAIARQLLHQLLNSFSLQSRTNKDIKFYATCSKRDRREEK